MVSTNVPFDKKDLGIASINLGMLQHLDKADQNTMKIYGRAVWKIRVVCRVMVMDKQDIIVRFVLND